MLDGQTVSDTYVETWYGVRGYLIQNLVGVRYPFKELLNYFLVEWKAVESKIERYYLNM